MSSVVIKKDVYFEELERVLLNILDKKEEIKLRIPATLKFSGGLGVEVNLIQIIITCFRLSKSNILHTYYNNSSNDDDKTYLENFNARLFGISALTMANQIVDSQNNILKKKFSLEPAIPYIQAMDKSDYQNTTKGKEVNLVSISGVKKEYISSLYNFGNKNNLKSSLELRTEIEQIFNFLVGFTLKKTTIKSKVTDTILDNISLLVHELFKNTDEHAKTNFKGDEYSRTINGIKFSFPEYDKERVIKVFAPNSMKYGNYLIKSFNDDEKIRFFEISIFDSGPGYARKWLKKDFSEFSLDEEKEAFKNCLRKHSTTKTGNSAGMGLTIVRKMLKSLDGYMRIRSGRLCFEEFSINNEKKSSFNDGVYGQIEGTSISICIPF